MTDFKNCIHGKDAQDYCKKCDKMTTIKTIDINALNWFDKVNGNSYFAGKVTLNYGLPDKKSFKMPFQYGYGDHYIDVAGELLQRESLVNLKTGGKYNIRLWQYCRDNNIILRTTKHENCKKKELMNI
jgi:hypothetical protein